MIAVGTGVEKSSNSLQYLQARLHRLTGIRWARSGWSVDATARVTIRTPRIVRCAALAVRRRILVIERMASSLLLQHMARISRIVLHSLLIQRRRAWL